MLSTEVLGTLLSWVHLGHALHQQCLVMLWSNRAQRSCISFIQTSLLTDTRHSAQRSWSRGLIQTHVTVWSCRRTPANTAAPVQARRKSLSSWRKGVVSERLAIWSKHQSDPEPHFPRHPTRLAMTSETPNMSSLTSSPMHKTSSTQG